MYQRWYENITNPNPTLVATTWWPPIGWYLEGNRDGLLELSDGRVLGALNRSEQAVDGDILG